MKRNTGSKWGEPQRRANELERRLVALERRTAWGPPVLPQDPPADSGVRMWMLTDGRLRGRTPEGAVVEYATTTPGAPTGPPLPEDWTTYPVTRRAQFPASWVVSYSEISGDPHPVAGATGGGVVAVLGWVRAELDAVLSGADEVTRVELVFHRVTAGSAGDGDVALTLHPHDAALQPPVRPPSVGEAVMVTAAGVGPVTTELPVAGWETGPGSLAGVIVDAWPLEDGGRIGTPADGDLFTPVLTITYRVVDPAATEEV